MSKGPQVGVSTLTKVLLGLVFLASLPMFYLAARVVKTWDVYRTQYVAHQKELARVREQIEAVREGLGQEQKSIRELKTSLTSALLNRGRAWFNVRPVTKNAQTGAVGVRTEFPNPPEIHEKDVLYVFEEIPRGTQGIGNFRYLGEFKVLQTGAPNPGNQDEPNIGLAPTAPLSKRELDKIANSRGPWALYETMPLDSHEVFAGKTDAEIRAFLPTPPGANQAAEGRRALKDFIEDEALDYLRDGKPADDADPIERVAVRVTFTKDFADLNQQEANQIAQLEISDKLIVEDAEATFDKETADQLVQMEVASPLERVYQRPLRDYSHIFREMNRQVPMLRDRIAALRQDLEYYDGVRDANGALQEPGVVQLMEQYYQDREALRQELEAEEKRLIDERDVVQARLAEATDLLNRYRQANANLLAQNASLADEWKRKQLEAAARIEQSASVTAAQ